MGAIGEKSDGAAKELKPDVVLSVLVVALTVLFAGGFLWINRSFEHDDAFITFRYARNWLEGLGPVWNEGERVQGYTNPLMLAGVALLQFTGMGALTAARFIGGASLLALAIWSLPAAAAIGSGKRVIVDRAILGLLVFTQAPLLLWALGGLESTLLCALLAWAIVVFLRSKSSKGLALSGLMFGLCGLARPDGLLFGLLTGVWLIGEVLSRGRTWRDVIWFAAPPAILLSAYAAVVFIYYGDILPNTLYAKTGTALSVRVASGLEYLGSFLFSAPFLPLIAVVMLVWARRFSRFTGTVFYLGLLIVGYGAYMLYAGGDHMQAFRLLVPVLPVLWLTISWATSRLLDQFEPDVFNKRMTAIVIGYSLVAYCQILDRNLSPEGPDRAANDGTVIGRYLEDRFPPGTLVALHTAGTTPYYAKDLRFIDMLGLNDAHIARVDVGDPLLPWQKVPGHGKGDGNYVLERDPDVIILGGACGTTPEAPLFLSDLQLGADIRFAERYEKVSVGISSGRDEETPLIYYLRKRRSGG